MSEKPVRDAFIALEAAAKKAIRATVTTMSSEQAFAARFWSKVNKQGPTPKSRPELGPCWIWLGYCRKGYGQFWLNGKLEQAHRIAFLLLGKPIPKGLEPDHLCRNKACVNPAHLEPTTHHENISRGVNKTHCKRGHLLSSGNLRIQPSQPTYRICALCERIRRKEYYLREGK